MITFSENFNYSLRFSDITVVDHVLSTKQDILILRHRNLGKILIINNEVQHVETWSPLYHEPLIHLPVAFLPKIEKVLILGGGSLFAAKEVLKYQDVKEVIMIDHDREVIKLMNKYYSHSQGVLQDKRIRIVYQDAYLYLSKLKTKFDLIVNDGADILSINRSDNSLFETLADCQSDMGICCDVIYKHILEKEHNQDTINLLRRYNSIFSLIMVPEYPGILHLLSIWSKNIKLSQTNYEIKNNIQKGWIEKPILNPCEYYNPNYLSYYLYLPKYLKNIVSFEA